MLRCVACLALLLVACDGAPQRASPPRPAQPVLAQTAPAPAPAPTPPLAVHRGVVVLVPLGSFPDDLLDEVERRLVDQFAVTVERHDPVPLPAFAYYRPRKRWRAEKLLDHLHDVVPDQRNGEPVRVLGLTTVDISTTKDEYKDWGVFGLGELPGRTSVISMFRLKRKARDREHLKFRVGTTAVHEIGHTFGLDHCGEAMSRCAMQDAEGSIANTDASTGALGPGCRAKLERGA